MKIRIALTVFFISFINYAFAVTAAWTGGTGNWDVPGNWSTGVIPDVTTDVFIEITDNVTIPSGYSAVALSVTLQNSGVLTIQSTGILNIDGTIGTAISMGTPASTGTLNNFGTINIGSGTAITGNAFVMNGSLTKLNNEANAVININNVSQFAFNMNLSAQVINKGNINIGNTGPVQLGGFAMDFSAQLDNQSTGIVHINNIPNGDGFYLQDSNVFNSGNIHIGNVSDIQFSGVLMELGSQFSNSSTATLSISKIVNSSISEGIAINIKSNSDFSNSGDLFIGNNGAIKNTGISIEFESSLTNASNGQIDINNITNLDAIAIKDQFTSFNNEGIVNIGNNSPVKRIGIFISNLASVNNNATGVINVDNINGIGSSEGYGLFISTAGLTNSGNINIGTNFPIARYGINVSVGGTILNQSSATLKINNVTNFDGIFLTGTGSTVTNNGSIQIGNLLIVKSIGISMFASSSFTNNSNGSITINNITNTSTTAGFGVYIGSSTFTNIGSLNIGNVSSISNLGIFVASGSLVNQNAGLIQINNIVTFDGIQGNGVGTSITNSGMIKIGNLSPVNRIGIYLVSSSAFQNNSGSIEINNITSTAASTGMGIALSNSSFTNNAILNIGNLSNISQFGIILFTPATFTNQTNGVIKISRVTLNDGIQIGGAASVFNNAGQVKIGDSGPINRIGLLISSGQFNNQAGSLLEINNIPTTDAIQVSSAGSLVTNNGTINIGNISGVYRFGIFMITGTFTNGSTGTLNINAILSLTTNEGIAIRMQTSSVFTNSNIVNIGSTSNISRFGLVMSSSSTFTNNAAGTVYLNRITSQSGVTLQTAAKIFNNGIFNIGNIAPINGAGILASGASEISNNVGGTLAINNTTLSDAIYLSGAGTKFTNNATMNIGNLFSIGGYGISADLAALFQNNSTGIINMDNTTAGAILLDSPSTIFNNKGLINLQ